MTAKESKETKTAPENFAASFEKIYTANIKREGADKLLEYLKTTDLFTAPASTRFHGNYQGGLIEHCVKVYKRFRCLLECEYGADYLKNPANAETVAIIALLHDICKLNCYKTEMRNVKVKNEWIQKPFFAFDDPLPYGHGEKSVYMISGFMRLTREEAMAINWHMGGFDVRNMDGKYTISGAFAQFPLTLIFHCADLMTSYLDEKIIPLK